MGYKISEQSERNVALQKAKSKYSSIVDTQTKSKITSMFNWLRRRQNAGLRNVEYSKKQVEKAEKDGKKNELKSCQVDGKTSWSPYTTPYAVIMDVSDPTRAKPLKALLWINLLMSKIEAKCPPAAQNAGFMKMAAINQINALNAHLQNVCKIDTLVLPLPYNQLLRTFLLIWNFTLPFVIASEVGWFNPIVMFLISAAFFGLDQVGVMLEQPFGTDAADISLLDIGKDLSDDLDDLLRCAEVVARRTVIEGHEPVASQTPIEPTGRGSLVANGVIGDDGAGGAIGGEGDIGVDDGEGGFDDDGFD